jgi:NAD(P)-dependent dehydrogenase (short-subunit alcohol dehydrogenase family)
VTSTALITGGTGGLGAAITREFVGTGWRVVVPWIAERELERLDSHPRVHPVRADLFDEGDARAAAEVAAGDDEAPLRAVVNLVGGFAMGGRLHETGIDDFETQLRLNLRPTYLASQAALPRLIANGGGAVVCVSSRAAVQPFPGAAGYITAKAAVLALVDAMAAEYKRDNIRVNAVLPSVIDTKANRAATPDADYSKWVAPEEIAKVIVFLCTDSSDVISGAHIPVYGQA